MANNPTVQLRRDAFEEVLQAENKLRNFALSCPDDQDPTEMYNELTRLLSTYRMAVERHTRLTVIR